MSVRSITSNEFIGVRVIQRHALLNRMPMADVDADTKSRLEELQAVVRERTGQEVTQGELLEQLVEGASESYVVNSFRTSTVPLSEAEKEAARSGTFNSDVETGEGDIDDILSGRLRPWELMALYLFENSLRENIHTKS